MITKIKNWFISTWGLLTTPITLPFIKELYCILKEAMLSIVLLFGFIYSIVVAYWLVYPYDPIRIDKFVVDKTVVEQGEEICFQFEGEKLLPLSANVLVELMNGESIQIMTYTANNPCGKLLRGRCFNIPYQLKPTIYQIKWTGTYEPNPLRQIKKIELSPKINVVENTSLKGLVGAKGDRGPKEDKGDRGDKGLNGNNRSNADTGPIGR